MEKIIFYLSLLVALLTGSYETQITTSIDSTNPTPTVNTRILWECPPYDGELCWWDIEKGNFGP